MGRDRDSGVKYGGIAGFRGKKGGKAESENPYCGPSVLYILVLNPRGGYSWEFLVRVFRPVLQVTPDPLSDQTHVSIPFFIPSL